MDNRWKAMAKQTWIRPNCTGSNLYMPPSRLRFEPIGKSLDAAEELIGCDDSFRKIIDGLWYYVPWNFAIILFQFNILMLRGFFVEFDLKKPLNYFAIEIGASEVRATIKLAIFGNTIYPRIYWIRRFFVEFCSNYYLIDMSIWFLKIIIDWSNLFREIRFIYY